MALKPIIIDCDPGADDAIALFLALASTDYLRILGITTVAGNVPLSLTQSNARKICELAGRPDVPVFAGCPRPMLRRLITAEEVHGTTGLDGIQLPEPSMVLQSQHAVDFLVDCVMTYPEKVTLATMGPLTNLAVALIKQPQIAQRIEEVVVMGGAISQGNVTPSAEFNIFVDPHAAQVVFTAGLAVTLISVDVTHQAIATPERIRALQSLNNPVSTAAISLLQYYGTFDMKRYGTPGPFLHDPCVVAYLLKPELFTHQLAYVEVETSSELTLGRTVADVWRVTPHRPNMTVVTSIDANGFYALLTEALAKYPTQSKITSMETS